MSDAIPASRDTEPLDEPPLPGLESCAVSAAAGDFKGAVKALERAPRPEGVDAVVWWTKVSELASELGSRANGSVQSRARKLEGNAEAIITRLERRAARTRVAEATTEAPTSQQHERTAERRATSAAFMERAMIERAARIMAPPDTPSTWSE
jgi:hypothetical protein